MSLLATRDNLGCIDVCVYIYIYIDGTRGLEKGVESSIWLIKIFSAHLTHDSEGSHN